MNDKCDDVAVADDDDDDDYSLDSIRNDENEEDDYALVIEHGMFSDDKDEDEEMDYPQKPRFYPTNLFDHTFPELANNDDDEVFQMSQDRFSQLVQYVLSSRFNCGLDFHERQDGRILRNAMIRYICAECNTTALGVM